MATVRANHPAVVDARGPESKRRKATEDSCGATVSGFTPINSLPLSRPELFERSTTVNSMEARGPSAAAERRPSTRITVPSNCLGLDDSAGTQPSRPQTVLFSACENGDESTKILKEPSIQLSRVSKRKLKQSKGQPSASDALKISKPRITAPSAPNVYQNNTKVRPGLNNDNEFQASETTVQKFDGFRCTSNTDSLDDGQNRAPRQVASHSDSFSIMTPRTTVSSLKSKSGFGCSLYDASPRPLDNSSFSPSSLPSFAVECQGRGAEEHGLSNSSNQLTFTWDDSRKVEQTDLNQPSVSRLDSSLPAPLGTILEVPEEELPGGGVERYFTTADSLTVDPLLEHVSDSDPRFPSEGPSSCQETNANHFTDDEFELCNDGLSDADFVGLVASPRKTSLAARRLSASPTSMPLAPEKSGTSAEWSIEMTSGDLTAPHDQADQEDYGWDDLEADDEQAMIDAAANIANCLFPSTALAAQHPKVPSCPVSQSTPQQAQSDPTLTSETVAAPSSCRAFRDNDDVPIKPIVRPPFAPSVRDRSPIVGVSPITTLRVCFRTGEALNVGAQAIRTGSSVIIELYARVVSSFREPPPSTKQHFAFTDIWAQRGPTLKGMFDIGKGNEVWDQDSRAFLVRKSSGGRLCRCVGRMKREEHELKLAVMSIWEAEWDDVEHVKRIVAPCGS